MRRPVVLAVLSLAARRGDPGGRSPGPPPSRGGPLHHRAAALFKNIYKKIWEGGAKGCTTFNKDGKRFALLTSAPKKEESESKACNFDPTAGQEERA